MQMQTVNSNTRPICRFLPSCKSNTAKYHTCVPDLYANLKTKASNSIEDVGPGASQLRMLFLPSIPPRIPERQRQELQLMMRGAQVHRNHVLPQGSRLSRQRLQPITRQSTESSQAWSRQARCSNTLSRRSLACGARSKASLLQITWRYNEANASQLKRR